MLVYLTNWYLSYQGILVFIGGLWRVYVEGIRTWSAPWGQSCWVGILRWAWLYLLLTAHRPRSAKWTTSAPNPKDLQNTQATVPVSVSSTPHFHILTVIPSSSLKLMHMSSIICIHCDNSDRHLSKPLPTGDVWMLWLKLQNPYEKQYNWPSREQKSSSILIQSDQAWHIEYKYSCYSVFSWTF